MKITSSLKYKTLQLSSLNWSKTLLQEMSTIKSLLEPKLKNKLKKNWQNSLMNKLSKGKETNTQISWKSFKDTMMKRLGLIIFRIFKMGKVSMKLKAYLKANLLKILINSNFLNRFLTGHSLVRLKLTVCRACQYHFSRIFSHGMIKIILLSLSCLGRSSLRIFNWRGKLKKAQKTKRNKEKRTVKIPKLQKWISILRYRILKKCWRRKTQRRNFRVRRRFL